MNSDAELFINQRQDYLTLLGNLDWHLNKDCFTDKLSEDVLKLAKRYKRLNEVH